MLSREFWKWFLNGHSSIYLSGFILTFYFWLPTIYFKIYPEFKRKRKERICRALSGRQDQSHCLTLLDLDNAIRQIKDSGIEPRCIVLDEEQYAVLTKILQKKQYLFLNTLNSKNYYQHMSLEIDNDLSKKFPDNFCDLRFL